MHLLMCIRLVIFKKVKKKLPLKQANSITTNFKELVHKLQVHKTILIEFAPSNGKTFSHLQMDVFWHFNFCYNRRNGFLHHFHPYLSHKVHNAYVKHYCSK